jgi:zinc protease
MVESDHRLPLVSLVVSFPVGAASDPKGKAGLSGLAMGMLKRGCPGFDAAEIETRLDSLGAEVDTGAGFASSMVACEVLTRSLDEVVELLSQMLAAPCHDRAQFGLLQRETVADIVESRNDDATLVVRALRRGLFAQHPHGTVALGTTATVAAIQPEDLSEHHERQHGRGSAIFAFAGDISAERAERISEILRAALPDTMATNSTPPEPSPRSGRHFTIVDKPARSQTQLAIGMLGTKPEDSDHTALCVANTALGGTFTSRLMQEIRAKRGWSYGASSQLSIGRIREAFSSHSAPTVEDAPACLALMVQLIEDWRDAGLSAAELDFCKGYLRRSHPFEIDTPKKRIRRRLQHLVLGLDNSFESSFLERLDAVTLDDANEAIRRRIDPRSMCFAAVTRAADAGEALREAASGIVSSEVLAVDFE